MSVLGLGTDIVTISRVEQAIEKSDRLAERVLTETELSIFRQHAQPGRYLAKRWAAKEAAAKAIGLGIGRGVSFHHFEITNDEYGAPHMTFTAKAQDIASQRGVKSVLLSISDEQDVAVATVVLSN